MYLITWSRVRLEKTAAVQPLEKFPAFYDKAYYRVHCPFSSLVLITAYLGTSSIISESSGNRSCFPKKIKKVSPASKYRRIPPPGQSLRNHS
jgi:hypothetical protein